MKLTIQSHNGFYAEMNVNGQRLTRQIAKHAAAKVRATGLITVSHEKSGLSIRLSTGKGK